MKIKLSIVTIALLLAGTANAQKVNFGIKGGLNVYTIHNDNDVDYDGKTGFHGGLLAHIHLGPQWALQPELVYSAQGAEYNTQSGNTKIKLGYINVPVMIQYMFNNGFRIQAGPQLGVLINAESQTNNNSIDISDDLNSMDVSLGAGLAYVHPSSGFGVDARYNLGLSNINESGPVKSTNRGFQLGVFYLFKHR